ncbi:Hexosaminidase D [Trichostrongylus colubriformis]|uniref:Hexosaminidase D n=1 Tax=Trichostrongylus colubriformis TaxID=6319 RepID=A0AAN8ICD8_TRICO
MHLTILLQFKVQCQSTHHETIVHFDLKGAPPRPGYFKQLLTVVSDLGADGVLIEWEDMFPYKGALERIKNGNAYSVDETLDILQHAHSLGLSVTPLVQSVGHLEWILKTKDFAHLRENTSFPMVACIGDDETQDLILDSIHQVISLHSKIRMSSIHIGADEVFQMGQCDADREVLPLKYGNNTKRLVFDYIRTVATNITTSFPKSEVLMWYDELKNVERSLIKEYELDRLVTPVVWKYTTYLEKDLPPKMWEELASSFSTVWGGSAFKGADGPNRYWNRMKTYVQNNRQWYLQAEQYGELFSNFHGFILTGWQRYDHFASLCELMPVSMASLAINLKIVKNFAVTENDADLILQALKCPSETTISQVISGEDKCHFAGYKVRDSIRDFMLVKQQYENASWVHNREAAYLQRSQIRLNASNPFYVDAVGRSYQRFIARLDKIMNQLEAAMNDIFFSDVFIEFSTDYIMPFYDELKQRLASVTAIDAQRTYRARPWFRR